MHWLIPLLMIFGFLTGHAIHDANFTLILTIFALLALWPLARGLWLEKSWKVGLLLAVIVLVLSIAVAPVFACLAVALGGGAWFLAEHYGRTLGRQLLIGGICAVLPALVVEPAGLALKLWHYGAEGLYYSVPPVVALTWFCLSGAMSVLLIRGVASKMVVPDGTMKSMLIVLAVATGVCTAFGLWLPAVLGLMLLLYGFQVLHYV
ncbi:TPA: hypothetical protein DEP96_02510 [Candidatus Uhrbacteria bacterium]|nr:hypothetical protein [Candidatus Uhrbacteria bacterium]